MKRISNKIRLDPEELEAIVADENKGGRRLINRQTVGGARFLFEGKTYLLREGNMLYLLEDSKRKEPVEIEGIVEFSLGCNHLGEYDGSQTLFLSHLPKGEYSKEFIEYLSKAQIISTRLIDSKNGNTKGICGLHPENRFASIEDAEPELNNVRNDYMFGFPFSGIIQDTLEKRPYLTRGK
ncbi:MAG: hypothetical protein U9O94_05055 [Nanoarchaeota archaeon]|nr:hypothetical protein [Nanoarchaeota archaeon]